ncbi:SAM-dependent methyltransferase [Naumannella cuiyingiana]|uniref:SAM-dependent methyltransferase n=1 Tax=Naumannella cuiyingiana TaxID=1347891 RepID=A0A7Z0D6L7_9ACTN|nr:class I SAM-dependent methyltransferase [Naumannella cuiyingiana]NYI69881.1 SAM-dependent methyltransferase [Naumannella cuiyingiana]
MTYTHGHHETVLRSHRWRTAENSVGHLLDRLDPSMRLLDIGSGPGTITADLADRVASVTAVEVSESALDLTRRTFAERGLAGEFVVSDAQDLDLPDDAFDVVHAHQLLHHLPDPVAALREMGRVCRPGGIIAVREVDYHGWTWFPELPGLDAWQDLFQAVARRNGSEPDAGRRLLAWAHGAGLSEVAYSADVWVFADPADRSWWGEHWAERIRHSAIADQALAEGLADRDDLAAIAQAWLAWAADPDAVLIMPHGRLLAAPPVSPAR